jgi:thiamine-phosphate pyrophosphorylase
VRVAITDRRVMTPSFGAAIARVTADLVQVREKDLDGAALLALVREAIATGQRIVVNDRVDVALAAGAYGVHLPERGLSIADARALGATFIGRSVHTLDGVRESEGADLIQLGPIFETPGKGPPLGLAILEHARSLTRAKLVAVGGIDSEARARAVLQTGADGVAMIRGAWLTAR